MLTTDTKSPFQSLTISSAIASALVSGAGAIGITIGSDEANFVIAGVLAAVAVYGRWRASRRIA